MNFISKLINKYKLDKKQKKIDILFQKDGLTNEVFNKQLLVNQQRNKMNITDPKQRIYKNWVQ